MGKKHKMFFFLDSPDPVRPQYRFMVLGAIAPSRGYSPACRTYLEIVFFFFFGANLICVVRKPAVQFTEIFSSSSIYLQTFYEYTSRLAW